MGRLGYLAAVAALSGALVFSGPAEAFRGGFGGWHGGFGGWRGGGWGWGWNRGWGWGGWGGWWPAYAGLGLGLAPSKVGWKGSERCASEL